MHKYFSLCFLWSEGAVTPQTWGHSSSFKHPHVAVVSKWCLMKPKLRWWLLSVYFVLGVLLSPMWNVG